MKRVTVRKHIEYKPDGTSITTSEFTEETSSNGLIDAAVAFVMFFCLFLGSVWMVRVMFVPPSPVIQQDNPTTTIGTEL